MSTMEAEEEGCRTPRHSGCQIPEAVVCRPAPKKKKLYTTERRDQLKNWGYFEPPDLELIFLVAPKRGASF